MTYKITPPPSDGDRIAKLHLAFLVGFLDYEAFRFTVIRISILPVPKPYKLFHSIWDFMVP
jgi:hypothetical protein